MKSRGVKLKSISGRIEKEAEFVSGIERKDGKIEEPAVTVSGRGREVRNRKVD